MTAISGVLITYVAWSFAFESYVRRNLQDTADFVALHTVTAYSTYGGWDPAIGSAIPKVGPRQDVIVQIFDVRDNLVYDESLFGIRPHDLYDFGGPPYDVQTTQSDIQMLQPEDRDVITAPVIVNSLQVGEVRLLAYGPAGLLTDHDLEMRTMSLLALATAGFVAICISTVIGIFYSRRLVMPIRQIADVAQRMRDGDEDARVSLAGDDDIAQLGRTFNRMADAVGKRRERERSMAGDVAHELRTPLMGIQATLEAIEDGIYPADTQHLQIISSETKRLTGLTNALLELTLLENYKEAFCLERIDVNEPVETSVAVSQARIESLGLTMVTDFTSDLQVNAHAARLQQAIMNLLSNAGRYTPKGGTITVRTYRQDSSARIAISDTGIGIDAEGLENIFRRFWRSDDARDFKKGGVGVGVPISKEIVDRHGGELTIESTKGEGTTCTIILPLAQ